MQNTSDLYKEIIECRDFWYETTVVVGASGNLVTRSGDKILFGGDAIVVSRGGPGSGYSEAIVNSVSTNINAFDKDMEIGAVVAQEIDFEMMEPAGELPKMSEVIPYVRAVTSPDEYARRYPESDIPAHRNVDGNIVSEWIQQGQFYIDTRESSKNDDGTMENAFPTIKIHGYDAIIKTEQPYGDSALEYPALDTDVVREIASKLGVQVDPRTFDVMTDGYTLPMLTSYSLRESLSIIAKKYLGFFIMSDTGQLRLVTVLEIPKETSLLIDYHGYRIVFGEGENETRIRV